MAIIEMHVGDEDEVNILSDLRRKDHVIIIGNAEGYYPDEQIGFTLVHEVAEVWREILASAKGKIGDVVSWYDEAEYVWYHTVIGYSIQDGWPLEYYEAITGAYDQIWGEHEDSHVRPFRTSAVARGKMRQHGKVNGNILLGMAAQANTECRLAVYTRIPA